MPSAPLPALLALTLTAFLAGAAGCGGREAEDALARIRARGALVVATEAEFRPFEYMQGTEIVGFDVDLARAIAADLGVRLELRNVKWESIVPELISRRADLIVSGMTVTEERSRTVRFSEPYFYTVTALLVAKAKADAIRSIADLDTPERTLAVKEGTTGDFAARQRCPRARIISHKTENGAALDVAEGRADAFLYDLASVKEHQRRDPERTVLLPEPVTYEPYAIAARPDAEERALVERVNAVIGAMRKDGRLAELMTRHGPDGSLEKR